MIRASTEERSYTSISPLFTRRMITVLLFTTLLVFPVENAIGDSCSEQDPCYRRMRALLKEFLQENGFTEKDLQKARSSLNRTSAGSRMEKAIRSHDRCRDAKGGRRCCRTGLEVCRAYIALIKWLKKNPNVLLAEREPGPRQDQVTGVRGPPNVEGPLPGVPRSPRQTAEPPVLGSPRPRLDPTDTWEDYQNRLRKHEINSRKQVDKLPDETGNTNKEDDARRNDNDKAVEDDLKEKLQAKKGELNYQLLSREFWRRGAKQSLDLLKRKDSPYLESVFEMEHMRYLDALNKIERLEKEIRSIQDQIHKRTRQGKYEDFLDGIR